MDKTSLAAVTHSNVYQLPGAADAPVVQARIAGRRPKKIVNLRRFKIEKICAEMERESCKSVKRIKKSIEWLEEALADKRYELAGALARSEAPQS